MTTETTQKAGLDELVEALTGFRLAVRTHAGYQESGEIANPDVVADALHATLSRIAAERGIAREAGTQEGGTLGRVLAIIRNVDEWLDAAVSEDYKTEPLGQHWGRVAKIGEEIGEARDELILGTVDSAYGRAIAALIALTGQNPRKGVCGTLDGLLKELGDVVVTGMFALQHFTKNENQTAAAIMAALEKAAKRAAEAGYGD